MSTLPRCRGMTRPKWYADPHPCRFPAWKDGYCRRHHPAIRSMSLDKEILAAQASYDSALRRLEAAETRLVQLKNEQERWRAFYRAGETTTPSRE